MDICDVLLIARHGATEHSAQGRFAGQLDVPLSETGRRQGAALAAALAAQRPTVVLASDLVRARDTAAEVGRVAGVPVRFDARLREEHLGRFQGRTHAQVRCDEPDAYQRWAEGDTGAYAGREGLTAVAERAFQAVGEAMTVEIGPIVVLTHANTAIALIGRLLDLPPVRWLAVGGLAPGHVTELRLGGRQWYLHRHNLTPRQEDASWPFHPSPASSRT